MFKILKVSKTRITKKSVVAFSHKSKYDQLRRQNHESNPSTNWRAEEKRKRKNNPRD